MGGGGEREKFKDLFLLLLLLLNSYFSHFRRSLFSSPRDANGLGKMCRMRVGKRKKQEQQRTFRSSKNARTILAYFHT